MDVWRGVRLTDHLDISQYITSQRLSLIKQVTHQAAELGFPACLVGGFVRDALLGRPVNDFDVVVEGDATKLGRALVKRFGGRLTVHAPFKTATWFHPDPPDDFIDLISARSETYPEPAALPTVKLGSLDEDLRRRDFTINAMALRLNGDDAGELVDPLDGHVDLKDGLVRVLHPRSFIDDPTRLYRLIRYSERYSFAVESGTGDLIPSALEYVDQLSSERLRHELDLVLEEENYLPMLDKLWAHGILQQIKPALPFDEGVRDRLQCISSPIIAKEIPQVRNRRWTAWLIGLPEKNIRALAKRLHFTSDLLKQSIGASELYRT
ncbi:CCA tRNA nucleotidyltransferase, partial [bacterium]|nr:CCA tRNA nucleotidyltransferase [bacterium]